jgi:hypothetical protein
MADRIQEFGDEKDLLLRSGAAGAFAFTATGRAGTAPFSTSLA